MVLAREEHTTWLPSVKFSAIKTYASNIIQTDPVIFTNTYVYTYTCTHKIHIYTYTYTYTSKPPVAVSEERDHKTVGEHGDVYGKV